MARVLFRAFRVRIRTIQFEATQWRWSDTFRTGNVCELVWSARKKKPSPTPSTPNPHRDTSEPCIRSTGMPGISFHDNRWFNNDYSFAHKNPLTRYGELWPAGNRKEGCVLPRCAILWAKSFRNCSPKNDELHRKDRYKSNTNRMITIPSLVLNKTNAQQKKASNKLRLNSLRTIAVARKWEHTHNHTQTPIFGMENCGEQIHLANDQ